jgi:hypothetical protein
MGQYLGLISGGFMLGMILNLSAIPGFGSVLLRVGETLIEKTMGISCIVVSKEGDSISKT